MRLLDAEILFRLIATLRKLHLANGEDLAECISILFQISTKTALDQQYTDYDDYH